MARLDSILKIAKRFIPTPLFRWLVSPYHCSLAWAADRWYRHPSRELIVIGVTGTKGKSATVYLAGRMLEAAGHTVGWSSSISLKIGEREWLNPYHMTTPGRFKLQQLLREMADAGCEYALIEVTSEAIKQFRHRHIWFDGAVFTNLAPEHIESHGSYEQYRAAKLELFSVVSARPQKTVRGRAVPRWVAVNLDDREAPRFLEFAVDAQYAFRILDAKFRRPDAPNILPLKARIFDAVNVAVGSDGSRFRFEERDQGTFVTTSLVGVFNISNILAAAAATMGEPDMDREVVRKVAAATVSIPGRMEEIRCGQPFRVIVDMAHTPDSFRAVFGAVETMRGAGERVIAVFGSAGGGRDAWKRPEMGKIAAEYADQLMLTTDDPFDEDTNAISKAIAVGARAAKPGIPIETILDRRCAIEAALQQARTHDVVLILGKGAEQTLILAQGSVEWDDRAVVREELTKLGYGK
ncbi:UDP-N-acetylmuramyl-tripeptide synthetase [Candidatus Parcubacteria bacterium]|nr:UDP-N-acetylmuramyl-tripeptide synthetase [Candidatus Parcubacteria bacterium]